MADTDKMLRVAISDDNRIFVALPDGSELRGVIDFAVKKSIDAPTTMTISLYLNDRING